MRPGFSCRRGLNSSGNNGYCTEAAQSVLAYGFSVLGLNRIYGYCLKRNLASGRVLEKIGMLQEGCLREHEKKWDQLEDVLVYGMLKSDWQSSNAKR